MSRYYIEYHLTDKETGKTEVYANKKDIIEHFNTYYQYINHVIKHNVLFLDRYEIKAVELDRPRTDGLRDGETPMHYVIRMQSRKSIRSIAKVLGVTSDEVRQMYNEYLDAINKRSS